MANAPDSYIMRSVGDGRSFFVEEERSRASYMSSMMRPASIDVDNVEKYKVVCATLPLYEYGCTSSSSLTRVHSRWSSTYTPEYQYNCGCHKPTLVILDLRHIAIPMGQRSMVFCYDNNEGSMSPRHSMSTMTCSRQCRKSMWRWLSLWRRTRQIWSLPLYHHIKPNSSFMMARSCKYWSHSRRYREVLRVGSRNSNMHALLGEKISSWFGTMISL